VTVVFPASICAIKPIFRTFCRSVRLGFFVIAVVILTGLSPGS
jgi:hypothetical protein